MLIVEIEEYIGKDHLHRVAHKKLWYQMIIRVQGNIVLSNVPYMMEHIAFKKVGLRNNFTKLL
jgi:hypothetical protein